MGTYDCDSAFALVGLKEVTLSPSPSRKGPGSEDSRAINSFPEQMLADWPATLVSRGVMCHSACRGRSQPDGSSPAVSQRFLGCLHRGYEEDLHNARDLGIKCVKRLGQFLADSRHRLSDHRHIPGGALMLSAPTACGPQAGFSRKLCTKVTPTCRCSAGFVTVRKVTLSVPGAPKGTPLLEGVSLLPFATRLWIYLPGSPQRCRLKAVTFWRLQRNGCCLDIGSHTARFAV